MIAKRLLLTIGLCGAAMAQLAPVPNSDFPTFRANLNTSLADGVSRSTNYTNPAYIASLSWLKITNIVVTSPVTYDTNTKAVGFLYTISQAPTAGQVPLVGDNGVLNIPGGFTAGNAVAFTNLGTAVFPAIIACSDCTVGSTCTGSGTGAYAFATAAGAWTCPF